MANVGWRQDNGDAKDGYLKKVMAWLLSSQEPRA